MENEGNVSVASSPTVDPTLDAEGAALRELAGKSQSGEITEEPKAATEEQPKAEASAQESEDRAPDAGTDKDKSDNSESSAELKADSPQGEQEPKSSYQKLKNDKDRLAENWKAFSEGKLKWQQEQAETLKAAREEAAQLRQQFEKFQAQGKPAQGEQYTSEEYAKAAEEFKSRAQKAIDEGDQENAKKFVALVADSRDAAWRTWLKEQQGDSQKQYEGFASAQKQDMEGMVKQHPELADPNTPDFKAMEALWKDNPEFSQMPNGMSKCYQVLQLIKAAEGSELKDKEIETLKQQLKEQQERTSISGSGPTPRVGPVSTDNMTPDQEENYLRNQIYRDAASSFAA